ncbi:MAG: DUF4345 family protein [Chloroflexota bacterium]
MDILKILQVIFLVLTAATGALSFVKPDAVYGFTGLTAAGARGVSEVRAVLGGLFIGLGVAPLVLNVPAAYRTVGIGYLAIAGARVISLVLDQSFTASNLISLAFEIIAGVVLVL